MKLQGGKTIAVGETVPNVEVENEAGELKMIGDVLGPGLSVLVGMPGAFTPTCTDLHLPSYYNAADDFAAFGAQSINVLTLNDKWVNAAWQKSAEECILGDESCESPITMLADPRGDLLEAMGMIAYLGREMGIRSKRFAMLVEGGVVKFVAVDEGSIAFEESACSDTHAATRAPELLAATPSLTTRYPDRFSLAQPPLRCSSTLTS